MVNLSGDVKIMLQQSREVSMLLKKDTISPPFIEAYTAESQDHLIQLVTPLTRLLFLELCSVGILMCNVRGAPDLPTWHLSPTQLQI